MRTAAAFLLGLGLVVTLWGGADAGEKEKKEVKLTGKITCAKCDLKVDGQTTCATVIVVKKKDKDIVYYFDKKSDKKYHEDICTTPMQGTVTGTVTKKDEKHTIHVTSLEFKK